MGIGPGKHIWRERVRASEPFEMVDLDFIDAVIEANNKAAAYNSGAASGPGEEMDNLLRGLLGKVGRGVVVRPPLAIDVGFNVEIGDDSFVNMNATMLDTYPIRIGARVQIGPNCAFYPVGHPLKASERIRRDADGKWIGHITTGAPIVIGDDVWIGGNSVILPGVTVGDRSVIGAGSVVTKSIPADAFAAGNPCRVVKNIT